MSDTFQFSAEVPAQLQVFNIMGELLADQELSGGRLCWNTQGTAPGIYIVRVSILSANGASRSIQQKIIVTGS